MAKDKQERIVITGANGLLGSHAVAILKGTHEIHAMVHRMPEQPVDGVIYHNIDLSANWSYSELPDSVDTLIHLAQSSHFREFPDMAMDVFRVNIESTARLLDYAQKSGVKRFINASSGGIYGTGNKAFDENSPIVSHGDLGYYLGSKLCSEILAQNYAFLMDIVVLRFFFMYGPGQNRSMLIPRLIDNVSEGRPILLDGDSGIRINPIYVGDAVQALNQAVRLNGSFTINIAGPEIVSLKGLGDIIGDELGVKPKFELKPGKPEDIIANIDTMKQKLFKPVVNPDQGIRKLINSSSFGLQ